MFKLHTDLAQVEEVRSLSVMIRAAVPVDKVVSIPYLFSVDSPERSVVTDGNR